MSSDFAFDPNAGLILIQAEVFGPRGSIILQLALDTGATGTLIHPGPLTVVGYEPSLAEDRIQITTGSGIEYAPVLSISRILCLGHSLADLPVMAHALPPSAGIDGLLGLDFMKGKHLGIDFRKGRITIL